MLMLRSYLAEEVIAGLPTEECDRLYRALRYRWSMWARPEQIVPKDDWDVLGLCAGRGGGKTRPGSEWCHELAAAHPGARMAIVARSSADARDTIVLGESGLVATARPWFRPRYYPSKRLVLWPNGFQAHLYTDAEPDLLRGPQHHFGWGDEFAAWRNKDTLSNLQDGLRLGPRPRLLLTTTPRRTGLFLDTFLGPKNRATGRRPVALEQTAANQWAFDIQIDDGARDARGHHVLRTIVRRWATEANALNLSPGFAQKRRAAYGDGAYGRAELDAEIQEILEGALFNLQRIDELRVDAAPTNYRRIVCVDPKHAETGPDECGIVVLGSGPAPAPKDPKASSDGRPHAYVLADRSLKSSPLAWGKAVVQAYDDFRADLVVFESNAPPGKPDVVPDVIKSVDPRGRIRWQPVRATADKASRAAPVASLYEGGRVHHVMDTNNPNHLSLLEHEMVSWDPGDPRAASPNRLDALVHGVRFLLLGETFLVAPQSVGQGESNWKGRA